MAGPLSHRNWSLVRCQLWLTHFRISSNSSAYARNKMPSQSPRPFIIFISFLLWFYYFLFLSDFSPGFHSTENKCDCNFNIPHPLLCQMRLKNHFSMKKKILIKTLKSKWSSLFKKIWLGEKKLVCNAPCDSLRTMHYKETFNAYKEKQTISNEDQIFSQSQAPKQRKQIQS